MGNFTNFLEIYKMQKFKIAIFNPYKKILAAENAVDADYESIMKTDDVDFNIKSFYSCEDIVSFNPDFIVSHSNFTPKFCHIPTYVVFNEPAQERMFKENQIRAYLTFDGYLTQSDSVSQKIKDLCFYYNKQCHILEFANSRKKNTYQQANFTNTKLTYFGNNWEVKSGDVHGVKRPRFEELFKILSKKLNDSKLGFYGDASGWNWIENKNHIKGSVSFGTPDAISRIYRENGIGLALSSHRFYEENLANNRIYEIVSSGALCVADDLPFYKGIFGNNLLYVTSRNEKEMANQIIEHLNWIEKNPQEAEQKAKNAHEIFCKKLCMEEMLKNLISFHKKVQQENYLNIGYKAELEKLQKPLVSVVIRSGGRSAKMVKRTLDSVANQTYDNIEVIFILYKENKELSQLAEEYLNKFSKLIVTQSSSHIRSTVMWEGMKKVSGEYLAILDDDDIWYENHLSKMMEFFDNNPSADFVYSGRVYYNEIGKFSAKKTFNELGAAYNEDLLFDLKNLTNSESKYCLSGFTKTDYNKMLTLDHPIHLCFLLKKSVLSKKIMIDPIIHYAEDLYFCALFYSEGCKFYWIPELTMQISFHYKNSLRDERESIAARDRISGRVFGVNSWSRLKEDCESNKTRFITQIEYSKKNKKIKYPKIRKIVLNFRDLSRKVRKNLK